MLDGDPTVAYVELEERAEHPLTKEEAGSLEGFDGWALVVERGPQAGLTFVLPAGLTTVGRHPESHIFLDDVTVSRRHAEFRREGERFTVSDDGSLNGTYVNRDRIDRVQLNDGDEVQIGKYRLVFFSGHSTE